VAFEEGRKMRQNIEASPLAPAAKLIARRCSTTDVETDILSICRRILTNNTFSATENFFDAGGDSLRAMTLILEIEKQIGVAIPLETIFATPTVRALCHPLQGKAPDQRADILPIRNGTMGINLYFTPGGFDFSTMSDAIGDEISSAIVTIRDVDWMKTLAASANSLVVVDSICDAYADVIAQRQQDGPCCLAGHSFGGIIAVETALKLQERGRAPDIVFLLDTNTNIPLHRVMYDIFYNGWLQEKLEQIVKGGFPSLSWLPFRKAIEHLTQTVRGNHGDSREPTYFAIVSDIHDGASRAYRGPCRELRGRTVLFRATLSMEGRTLRQNPNIGWARQLGKNFEIIPTRSNHYDMVKGDAARLIGAEIGRQMKALLTRA
jgi:thioesterase domain-containing protein/acyl carrier protein